ncbi:FAD-dependent oxidoreductase [Comamonas testosteroni]|uniref:FAD-dependent oxidoreductase n=1 Tax=Comamonas testosteroni TaxID=285 RepID=UPI002DBF49AA|nr:FAD-dependent oxidoreductase [Comamonas testosteroni]MEB5967214.1 FAD-dependent oxidoreductase [Comamonas testosteroni]
MAEQEYDLIVVGSGAGALLGAIRAQEQGLRTLLVEKTELFGGTSALSGGGIWIPVNYDQKNVGIKDDLETAFGYLKRCVRGMATDDRVLAYVETASKMAEYLRKIGIPYRAMAKYADYYPHIEGSRPGGRTMDPVDFNAAKLGLAALETMRPGPPGNQLFGRMSISAFEAHSMLSRELKSRFTILGIMLRYFLDYPWRSKTRRDRRMTGGQALVAGLLAAANKAGVEMWRNAPLKELVRAPGGRVTAVIVEKDGQRLQIKAGRGVLLGAGGFERNQEMRDQYLNKPTKAEWTATPAGCNTGDAHRAGQAVGAQLALMDWSWGVPTMDVPKEPAFRGIFVERSLPGCMVVNNRGQRFLNESGPYPEFQQAMLAEHAKGNGGVPAWIVFDASFRAQNPMGPLMPGSAVPDSKLRKSWLNNVYWKGETLEDLARQIGVDAAGLKESARRMSEYARVGKDPDFGRGSNVFDRYYGDPRLVNPNLGPIEKGPFYAMRLWPGEIGTKGGLLTDRDGRVLDTQGEIIEGLYCVGNNSASVMGPAYAGAGSTLGPAMTFAFRAVAHMLGTPLSLENPHLLGRTV